MRKVFLLSLLLVVLSLVIPWLVVTLSPAQEPAVQPIPSVTASAAVAPDSETAITALSGGELVETTMADWLPGVVAAEMPASYAHAARAARRRGRGDDDGRIPPRRAARGDARLVRA